MKNSFTFIDLFCGIGGFRISLARAARQFNLESRCVFSSDIDTEAAKTYQANFGEYPSGDVFKILPESIPDHDVLCAGFPCQPFSIMGNSEGFQDSRGTLFFEIAKILQAKRPKSFLLENVKQLASHQGGATLKRILSVLRELGYSVDYKILNSLDFGLPQKRERLFIAGFNQLVDFTWPQGDQPLKPLKDILETRVDQKYFASEKIRQKRQSQHRAMTSPAIWHENKSGNISSKPYSCALRAGASHNYLLVDGKRRLTPREMLRLQGFPDNFKIVCADAQVKRQTGNSVAVNVVEAVFKNFIPTLMGVPFSDSNSSVASNEEKRSLEDQMAF